MGGPQKVYYLTDLPSPDIVAWFSIKVPSLNILIVHGLLICFILSLQCFINDVKVEVLTLYNSLATGLQLEINLLMHFN